MSVAAGPRRGAGGWVPALLVALAAVPVASGVLRLVQLSGGPAVMPADARFTAEPVAVVVHVLATVVLALGGAFQFVPALRRRGRSWHRRAGRVVATAGLLVAVSGLWLVLGYPAKPGTGAVLYLARLVVAPATALSLVLGVLAARRRDLRAHRAWMIRAYALCLGAGTQVFTKGFGAALFGGGVVASDVELVAGWVVNLAVAEYLVRRPARRRPIVATAAGPAQVLR
jgi:uncharacterized membrane protein